MDNIQNNSNNTNIPVVNNTQGENTPTTPTQTNNTHSTISSANNNNNVTQNTSNSTDQDQTQGPSIKERIQQVFTSVYNFIAGLVNTVICGLLFGSANNTDTTNSTNTTNNTNTTNSTNSTNSTDTTNSTNEAPELTPEQIQEAREQKITTYQTAIENLSNYDLEFKETDNLKANTLLQNNDQEAANYNQTHGGKTNLDAWNARKSAWKSHIECFEEGFNEVFNEVKNFNFAMTDIVSKIKSNESITTAYTFMRWNTDDLQTNPVDELVKSARTKLLELQKSD